MPVSLQEVYISEGLYLIHPCINGSTNEIMTHIMECDWFSLDYSSCWLSPVRLTPNSERDCLKVN